MAIYFSILCNLQLWKIAPKHFFAKVSSKYYQTLNKPSNVCLRLLTFGQSGGEISPNLVTLVPNKSDFAANDQSQICAFDRVSGGQCDQIGRFLKVLGDKFWCKSSPNIWRLSELFWKGFHFTYKLRWLLFGQVLKKIWLLFMPSCDTGSQYHLFSIILSLKNIFSPRSCSIDYIKRAHNTPGVDVINKF